MAKKVLSIVIGNECTKVCEVSYKKNNRNKGIRVYRSISFTNPDNSVEDGFIKDIELFRDELNRQLKVGRLKSDKVIFSIASSKIANREIILPPTNEKKIMDIIMTGASEYFPIDIKDYILSYIILEKKVSARKSKAIKKKLDKKEMTLAKQQQKLDKKALKKRSATEIIAEKMEQMDLNASEQLKVTPEVTNSTTENVIEGKKHMRINIYAVPSSLVKNYYSFAKTAHLDILSFDYSGNSSYQIIKRQGNRGTNVYVQLNERDTLVSILRDDVLILQRTIGYGISMLTDAIMEQDFYNISDNTEALELLSNRNLLTGDSERPESILFETIRDQGEAAVASEFLIAAEASKKLEERKEKEAKQNMLESLHYLTNSIARMLDYYKTNHKNEDINRVYISGTGVCILGIDQFFQTEIGVQNRKMDKLWTVSAIKKAALYRKHPSEFISCVGAVIKPINFVPKEFVEKKQKRSTVIATIVFSLACIVSSAGTIYVAYSDYLTAKHELSDENAQKDALPDISSVYINNDKVEKDLSSLQDFEAATNSNNEHINDILTQLKEKLPTGTKIDSMQFSETGITMTATADDHNVGASALQAKLLTQLETIEYFATVDVEINTIEEGLESNYVSFTINCTYQQ